MTGATAAAPPGRRRDIYCQTAAVEHARLTGRPPRRQPNGRNAEELQALDEALLRDLEAALDRAYSDEEPTPGWWNLAAARDAVADWVVARAGRIDRRRRTAKTAKVAR